MAYLLRGEVRFTPPRELNDPSELLPLYDCESVRSSLAKLRSNGYSDEDLTALQQQGALLAKLDPRSMVVPPPKTLSEANRLVKSRFYDQADILGELLKRTMTTISSKVGVFCLTKAIGSLPMWAHYASNARGAIVQFDGLSQEFPGDETGILNELRDVEYFTIRPSVTFDPSSHKHLYFSKLSDWAYERESRVVLALSDCKPLEINDGLTLHLHTLKHAKASRVILGWNVTQAEVDDRLIEWRAMSPDIVIQRAEFKGDAISVTDL